MTFNEYQKRAKETAMYKKNTFEGLNYVIHGLNGESGEISNKFKKIIRDNNSELTSDIVTDLAKEVGDCLWYIAMISSELGFDLDDIAEENVIKLSSRFERGVIQGSGDNR